MTINGIKRKGKIAGEERQVVCFHTKAELFRKKSDSPALFSDRHHRPQKGLIQYCQSSRFVLDLIRFLVSQYEPSGTISWRP